MKRWPVAVVVAACGGPPRDPPPIAWRAPVAIAEGGGVRGRWQQNDSYYDYVDDPSVALEPDGAAAIAWVDHRAKDVWFQVYEPAGRARWSRPVNVSRSPAVFSWLPRVALSPVAPAHVYVLWQEIVFSGGTHGGEIFFARSRDGGASFEPPRNLSRSIQGDGKGRLTPARWHNGSLDLAVGPDGTIYAAWTAYEGPLWIARSRDGGASFEPPRVIDDGARGPARAPALAVRDRLVALAWTVGDDPRADVRVATSRDGVTFSAPVVVARTPGYSDAPKLAFDRAGALHLVYAELAGGPFGPPRVMYTRARDDLAFAPPRALAADAGSPSLAIDGEAIYVAWDRYPGGREPPRGLGLAVSRDGGATFTETARIAGTEGRGANGSREGRLMRKLAVRDGTIVVVNSALDPGAGSLVWYVRGALRAGSGVARR